MPTYSGIVPAQLSPTNPLLRLSQADLTSVLQCSTLLQFTNKGIVIYTHPGSVKWDVSQYGPGTFANNVAAIDPTGSGYVEVINYFLTFALVSYSTASGFVTTINYNGKSDPRPYEAPAILPPGGVKGGNIVPVPAYTDVYIGHYTKFTGKTVDFGGCALSSIADPVNDQDVASKKYIDAKVSPLATVSSVATALTNANSYTDTAVSTASTTLNASISAVQTQVSNILTGADTTSDTLAKVAALAQSLDASETASLSSAVASLQDQINTKSTDISALQTLTAGYATEFDTVKIKQAYIDFEESGPFNNSIKTDPATGNLVLSTPTANGSCVVNIPTNWFLTDTIGATSYSSVQFNNAIDMGGYYNQPKKILHLADASDPADAMAYHQFTEYKSSNDSALATIASNLALEASRADTVEKQLGTDINTLKSTVVYATGKASQNIDGSLNLGNVQLNNLNVFYTLDVKSNKIKNVAFGTDNNDAVAFKQLADEVARAQAAEATLTAKCNDLQSQLTVQSGYITQVYQYIWNTAPSVVPTR